MFRGLLSGLFAGILYGVVVMLRGGMHLYGSIIGIPEVVFGWAVLLAYVALLGALFGLIFGRITKLSLLLIIGLAYGLGAGVLMIFLIMPLALQMSLHISVGAALHALPVFIGYTIFGGVMALCYHMIRSNE